MSKIKHNIKNTIKVFFDKNIADGNLVILLFIFVVGLLKIATNFAFFYANSFFSFASSIVNYLLTFIFIIFLGIFEYRKTRFELTTTKTLEEQKRKFVNDYSFIFIEVAIILLLQIILLNYSEISISNYNYTSSLSIILSNIVFIISSFVGIQVLYFVYYWLMFRRYKLTKFIIMSVFAIGLTTHVIKIVETYYNINICQVKIFGISYLDFLFFLLAAIIIITTRNFNWLATIPTKKKIIIIFVSLASAFISLLVIRFMTFEENMQNVDFFISTAYGVFVLSTAVIFAAYSTKIIVLIIASLPTAKIIDKKASEIYSINNIYQQIISVETDFNSLLKNILVNAKRSIGATGAWCELYKNSSGDDLEILYVDSIAISEIEAAHRLNWLKPAFLSINEPKVIESVPNDKKFSLLSEFVPSAESAAIIPIISKSKKIGTIILTHKKEYKIDSENLILMRTLFDIMNAVYNNVKVVKESIELSKEFALGQKIQEKLLPQYTPIINKYSISTYSKAAKEVGGDYFDFLTLANGKPCVIIGDVSGKGLTAAFIMAYIKGIVTAVAPRANSPKELLEITNNSLVNEIDKRLFVTILAFVIDDEMGNITFARAGHPPLLAKISEDYKYLTPRGIGIGILNKNNMAEISFSDKIDEMSIKLNPGDFCVLFTDGVSEAMNSENEEFGLSKLKKTVEFISKNNNNISSSEIIESIITEINNFTDGAEAHDDITVLAIKHNY